MKPFAIPAFPCFVLAISLAATGDDPAIRTAADLRRAATSGDLAEVKACLEAGVPVDAANAYGVTALLLAADHQQVEMAELLLEAGADPGVKDRFYGFTPLRWALTRKQNRLVGALVAAGAPDAGQVLTMLVYDNNSDAIAAMLQPDVLAEDDIRWAARQARILDRAACLELLLEALGDEAGDDNLDSDPETDGGPFAAYLGTYVNEEGSTTRLVTKNRALAAQSEGSSFAQTLQHLSPNVFKAGIAEFSFDRDDDDKIVAMRRTFRGDTTRFIRVENAVMPTADAATDTTDTSDEPEPVKPTIASVDPELRDDFAFTSVPWAGFRGHLARGVVDNNSIATIWDVESGDGLAWKTPIPGLANACPIVWDNRVFLTTAVSDNESSTGFGVGLSGDVASVDEQDAWSFRVLCLDLATGEVLWDREANHAVPAVKRHIKSSHANPTPATDGRILVASFGSEGVYGFDLDGNQLWKRDFGKLDSGWFYDPSYQWGFGSSPCVSDGRVYLQCDIQEGSFLIALDIETGETIWRTERDEIPTWGSPVAYTAPDGTPTVVVSGTKSNAAYDARDGSLLWRIGGFSEIVAPTPQVTPRGVLLTSGYSPVQPIVLVRHDARGTLRLPEDDYFQSDASGDNVEPGIVWSRRRGGPYMATPVIHDGLLYTCGTSGIVGCYVAATGQRLYKKRIRGDGASSFTGSPVAAGDAIYFPSEQGVIKIVKAGESFELLGSPEIGESTLSTPAIADGFLLIRGEEHLFAFGPDASGKDPAGP